MTGFLGAIYYSKYCDVGYSNREDHRCADGFEDCFSDIPCIPWTVKELFLLETGLLSISQ